VQPHDFPVYANRYPEVLHRQSGWIPVENCEFSTFSTDFSTGVVHRRATLWIFTLVYITILRHTGFFGFISGGHNLHNCPGCAFKNNS
jgi:hypothetical protein